MKYTQSEAMEVLDMFQRFLGQTIQTRRYHTEEFFHVFEIVPILINGNLKNFIRFKDSLIDDCLNTGGNLPDVSDFVNICFY